MLGVWPEDCSELKANQMASGWTAASCSLALKQLLSRLRYNACPERMVGVLCRFCQMMWRLNFLVLFTCIALQNSYMLYYICPMHTLFTIMVYASLGLASQYNQTRSGVWTKCGLFLCTNIMFHGTNMLDQF